MKFDRFRAPALAATAVLVISGAGIAFAGTPRPAAVTPPAVTQAAPAALADPVEPTGPDTDTLQQGDQTTPDVVGATAVQASAPKAAVKAAGASATKAAAPAEAPGEATAPETGAEAPSTEADGPGGHEDPAGQNVDHQSEGQE